MRAIIKCRAIIDTEELDAVLSQHEWWPNLPQECEEIKAKRNDILEHIPPEDRTIAEKTYLFTIYDEGSRSWGIVSNPAKHVLTFRIKNPVSDKLKSACEKIVKDLRTSSGGKKKDDKISFDFFPKVEVLEPNSDNHAFSGEILPPKRLLLAIKERKTEAYVGLFTAITTIFVLFFTSPIGSLFVFNNVSTGWKVWLSGNLERISTAVLVTTIISWFEVILHWFDIRRKSIIRWSLE